MQPDPDTPLLLDVIDIPEPCQVPWETMTGDERIRFCGMCKKNVYNISEMGTSEAEDFLQENLGSVCLSFIRRADGTVVTDNCPKILRPVRDGFRFMRKVAAIVLGALISSSPCFAQTKSSPQSPNERNAALAAGTYGKRMRTSGFAFSPNVWRAEKPYYPTPPLAELTSGEFALSQSEVYVQDGKTYISEEPQPKTEKRQSKEARPVGACIDGCAPSGAYRRGKEWLTKHNDRVAESYFKFALKSLSRYRFEPESEIQLIVQTYADLLRRNRRFSEAKLLLESDVAKKRENLHGSIPRGRSILGLDPAMLARRSLQPVPIVRPPEFAVPVPMLNPFAPNSQRQSRDLGEKKKSPKAKQPKQ